MQLVLIGIFVFPMSLWPGTIRAYCKHYTLYCSVLYTCIVSFVCENKIFCYSTYKERGYARLLYTLSHWVHRLCYIETRETEWGIWGWSKIKLSICKNKNSIVSNIVIQNKYWYLISMVSMEIQPNRSQNFVIPQFSLWYQEWTVYLGWSLNSELLYVSSEIVSEIL
jgi:hypothetical protein